MPILSNTYSLVVEARNRTGEAFRSLRNEMNQNTRAIQQQRLEFKQLQAQESVRAAQARVGLAQVQAQARAEALVKNNNVRTQNAAAVASERLARANNSLEVARRRAALIPDALPNDVPDLFQRGEQFAGRFNAALLAIAATVGIVSFAFNKLSSALGSAIERETDTVSSVITATKTLGLTQAQSAQYVQDFNRQAAILGKNLPVTAENISVLARTISDDYAAALRGAGATVGQIRDVTLGSSARLALVAQQGNVNVRDARQAVNAYLSGSVGPGGLDQYTLFANNTLLRGNLISGLQQTGAKSFGDLSAFQRVKLLTEALDKAISPEDIALLQGTTAAKISSFTDSLFDPEIGLFSLTRDLDQKLPGYQSVYSSFQETLGLIIGEDGILTQFSRLLGGGRDPMLTVRDAVDSFNGLLRGLRDSLAGLKNASPEAIGAAVGRFTAQAVNFVFNGVLGALATIPYGAILRGAAAGIGSFFANLDWKIYGVAAIGIVAAVFLPMVGTAIATVGGAIIAGIVATVGGVPLAIGAAVVVGIIAITQLIRQNWDAISTTAGGWLSQIQSGVDSFFRLIGEGISNIVNFAQNLWGGIKSRLIDPVSSTLGNLTGGFIGTPSEARYRGFLPPAISAANGLMGAIAAEQAYKPPGSSLVIANSTEAVLTPEMVQGLTANAYAMGRSVNVAFDQGAISMVLPAGTPQDIALAAIAIIEERLSTELESRLAYG